VNPDVTERTTGGAGGGRTYPRVRVSGGPRERGRQYGEQTRERVRRSVEAYAAVFDYYAHIGWEAARAAAAPFAGAIEAYEPKYLEELHGIAEGAGLDLGDVLALNLRTEIMYARRASGSPGTAPARDGCSSVAVLPRASVNGHTLLGQNWDWLIHSWDTTIVLEAEQDEGPDFVTVVEAGLLAKTGMNAAGLGLVTNTIVSDRDVGALGVPYHVCLRSLLDAEDIVDALARLQRATRSSSANYLLASSDGLAVNVESTPGDATHLLLDQPTDGLLTHTNHFVSPRFDGLDAGLALMPDSFFRLQRLDETVRGAAVGMAPAAGVAPAGLQRVFADHAGHPYGVCSHPDAVSPPVDQSATIASVIMDLDERILWLADGNPCEAAYRELDYADFLGAKTGEVTP
jgi:isopenicillin-N N-acyltransferase-like protein